MVPCKDWFEAIRCDETGELKRLVNEGNVNTRAKEAGGAGEYTPVQFLARISPGNSPAMLEYLLSIGADLSLKANTADCIITRYCTTIGNLASYRINEKGKWWDSKAYKDFFYAESDKANKTTNAGHFDKAIQIANDIKMQKCHPKTNYMYDALSQLKQGGKNVPGLNIAAWLSRGARKLLRGTGTVAQGALIFGAAAASGGIPITSSMPQDQSFNTRKKGGRKSKAVNSRRKIKCRINRDLKINPFIIKG
jgi:hypothetical protein